MSLLKWTSTRIRQALGGVGTRVLTFCLPVEGKRSMLLTSLFVEIAKISPAHEQCLRELNARLNIASHTSAMLLPARIHHRLWGKANIDELVEIQATGGGGDTVSSRLLSVAPSWTRYGSQEKMLEEIREVIRLGQRFQHQPE